MNNRFRTNCSAKSSSGLTCCAQKIWPGSTERMKAAKRPTESEKRILGVIKSVGQKE